jgi:hypothetical protein
MVFLLGWFLLISRILPGSIVVVNPGFQDLLPSNQPVGGFLGRVERPFIGLLVPDVHSFPTTVVAKPHGTNVRALEPHLKLILSDFHETEIRVHDLAFLVGGEEMRVVQSRPWSFSVDVVVLAEADQVHRVNITGHLDTVRVALAKLVDDLSAVIAQNLNAILDRRVLVGDVAGHGVLLGGFLADRNYVTGSP